MTLGLLGESALRAALLGVCVFAVLRLARLRDSRTETLVWCLVLAAALAMPLLARWLPGGVAVPRLEIPHAVQAGLAAAPHAMPALGIALVALHTPAAPSSLSQLAAWCGAHDLPLLWSLYGFIALIGLTRLAAGLLLTARLYLQAEPVGEDWAVGKRIRASAIIGGPLSFAFFILLPADYRDWPPVKRAAVLAHEEAHIGRGDFFILLLAACHRALFWFSPFAWWLEARLCALAETASDDAAIRLLDDPAGYAEILVDVARRAHRMPAVVAMARGPGIAQPGRPYPVRRAGTDAWAGRPGCAAAACRAGNWHPSLLLAPMPRCRRSRRFPPSSSRGVRQ